MANQTERTVIFCAKERTEKYLDKLYDHTKQLVTLSTATAAIFISLYDGNLFANCLLYPLLILAGSATFSMGALTLVTRMIASGEEYKAGIRNSNWKGRGLWLCHILSVVALIVGLVWFGLARA